MRVVSEQFLQVKIDSARTGTGANAVGSFVGVERAVYRFTDTIRIADVAGTKVFGNALGGTILEVAVTDPNKDLFDLSGCRGVELAYFTIRAINPFRNVFRISDQGQGVSPIRSSQNYIHDIDVEDCDGGIQTIIHIAAPPDSGKNDLGVVERVTAKDYAHSFVRGEGQAAVGWTFRDCRAQGRDHGLYGIYAKQDGQPGRGFQFLWEGGALMEHQNYDVYGDWRNGTSKLIKVTCEQSARFYGAESAGASFSGHNFTVDGGEWVNNATIHPADDEIVQAYAGALHIRGMTFGQSANVNDYKFRYDPTPTKRLGWTFRDNVLWTPLVAGHFVGIAPDSVQGSWRRSGSADTVAL